MSRTGQKIKRWRQKKAHVWRGSMLRRRQRRGGVGRGGEGARDEAAALVALDEAAIQAPSRRTLRSLPSRSGNGSGGSGGNIITKQRFIILPNSANPIRLNSEITRSTFHSLE